MKRRSFGERSREELFKQLRKVPTREGKLPYKDSYMTMVTMDPRILAPCQRYVLTDEVEKIKELYWRILSHAAYYSLDILNFPSHIGYIQGFADPELDILPVIVEEQFIGGRLYPIICDGQHRSFFAYQMHLPLTVVYIRGVSEPYYAFPVWKGWEGVEMIESIPQGYIKKFHAYEDYKAHFRDFTKIFNNGSVSRPRKP